MSEAVIRLHVDNLSCAGCAGRAERALAAVAGVRAAAVNFATATATVEMEPANIPALTQALRQANYPARCETTVLQVEGMSCASCVARVEAALTKVTGVESASVNLVNNSAQVTYVEGVTDPAALAAHLTHAGYPAHSDGMQAGHSHEDDIGQARQRALIAVMLALPVFVLEMGSHVIPGFAALIAQSLGTGLSHWLQFVLTTLCLIWPGRVFFSRGVPALLKAEPEMNSLVALGTFAAWSYSVIVLLWPSLLPDAARVVYFEAAAVIVALVLIGRWMEARARGQAGAAIRALLDLNPAQAWVWRADDWHSVPTDQVVAGDRLQVRPGAQVPVDGTVLTGTSWVNEAMVTGEPMPVTKATGDPLTGGTINGDGLLEMQATAVGSDTVLARIVATVEAAQGTKLPVQALADRVVRVFVPVVLLVAALTVLGWLVLTGGGLTQALVAGVSVLIIACPCAMGLATPTSIMVGTGRAAELGVLFRKGDALQRLEGVRLLAFDKTGTLTQGRPAVTAVQITGTLPEAEMIRLLAAAEAGSDHPVAHAVVAHAGAADLPRAQHVQALPGLGVAAQVEGHQLLAGSARLMQTHHIEIPEQASAVAAQLAGQGQSVLFVAIDGSLAALLGLSDQLKDETADTLAALKRMDLELAMITGDSVEAAQPVAEALGIDRIEASVLPDGKAARVTALRDAAGAVGFVGDGINDGPALAAADVGIAIGGGTDVAIEAADVVLLSNQITAVRTALSVSRRTMRNIRQNLFWAFAYNVVLIPVAALGLISPMLAAGAMALSSVCVVGNALRLRRMQAH